MRQFLGSIILESLSDTAPLASWSPVVQTVADMPDDPDAKEWHTHWYLVDEPELRSRLEALAGVMKPHWYAHFWQGDELCVILAGKAFWAKCSDRATWAPFIAYGDTVGVDRKWTQSVPTTVPAYVAAALNR